MNDKVLEIINGIGMLAELWTITYNSFKKQGLDNKEALTHTKEFMAVMVSEVVNKGNTKED
jgi:hypothetical protein